jgi:hypothetical protein
MSHPSKHALQRLEAAFRALSWLACDRISIGATNARNAKALHREVPFTCSNGRIAEVAGMHN